MGSRQVRLTATLLDSEERPISGKTIIFEYKGSGATTWIRIGTATTDANGNASVTATVSSPGTYDFRATFEGDSLYEGSSTTLTNITVKEKTGIILRVQAL
jgi:hypothetical protein